MTERKPAKAVTRCCCSARLDFFCWEGGGGGGVGGVGGREGGVLVASSHLLFLVHKQQKLK